MVRSNEVGEEKGSEKEDGGVEGEEEDIADKGVDFKGGGQNENNLHSGQRVGKEKQPNVRNSNYNSLADQ